MDKISTKSKTNNWIGYAAEEFRKARIRWQLTSDRKFSELTGINVRTLRKLNPKHLDATLTKETFDHIISTMLYLCPCFFEGEDELAEECRLLQESWIWVSRHVKAIHPKAQATYKREMESIRKAREEAT